MLSSVANMLSTQAYLVQEKPLNSLSQPASEAPIEIPTQFLKLITFTTNSFKTNPPKPPPTEACYRSQIAMPQCRNQPTKLNEFPNWKEIPRLEFPHTSTKGKCEEGNFSKLETAEDTLRKSWEILKLIIYSRKITKEAL